MKLSLTAGLVFLVFAFAKSQVILITPPGESGYPVYSQRPSKEFKFNSTVEKYEFTPRSVRIELIDNRDKLQIAKTNCSTTGVTNKTEYKGANGISAVYQYFQHILPECGIMIDTAATDTLKIELQVLDSRIGGFSTEEAHGLCQAKIDYKGKEKTYCIDIINYALKDSRYITSKKSTITRITSEAIRETIEQFLRDVKSQLKLNAA